jgi:hypothetical protein
VTSYFAYDHGLPCRNPSCKSYGKPHPQCRCYGDHAEGGDAAFCSADRTHNEACEYFAGGGGVVDPNDVIPDEVSHHGADVDPSDIIPDEIDPSDVIIDKTGPVRQASDKSVPFDDLPEDTAVPFDDLPDDESPATERYSTPGQQLATAAEGLAQGIAGPAATAAELEYSKLNPSSQRAVKHFAGHLIPGGAGLALGSALDALSSQGITAQDIAGRQASNPWEHGLSEATGLIGSAFSGVGGAGLANKVAEAAAKFTELGKIGSAFVKGAISNGLIEGSDEVSKWLLGQGNPEDPVGAATHIGAAALLGGGIGGFGQTAAAGLRRVAETKAAAKLSSYLAGFASAAQHPVGERETVDDAMKLIYDEGLHPHGSFDIYKAGQDGFDNGITKGVSLIARTAGAHVGEAIGGGLTGGMIGMQVGKALAKPLGRILGSVAGPAIKNVAPVAMKILSSNSTAGLLDALGHAENVSSGYDAVGRSIDSLFSAGINAGVNASKEDRKALDDYIGSGGINQHIQQMADDQDIVPDLQGYAKGGAVSPARQRQPALANQDGVAMHYPEQNILLSAAKGRVSNYLSSLRPQTNQPKLAFDPEPDTSHLCRNYNQALDIANAPLSVLDEIRKGTVESGHVKHFNAMYPELNGLLQRKLTERITQMQLDGQKPSYKVRQGLSLFMGTPLSGDFLPQNIQAAQAAFRQVNKKPDPDQPMAGRARGTASLTKSDESYLTGPQSLQKRQQRT